MSRIRSKGTGPERAMAAALRRIRARGWRRHRRVLGVSLDFSWASERVGLQVDGCFWHGCPRHYRAPRTNRAFWRGKLDANTRRDSLQARWMRTCGWALIHAFECQIRRPGDALMLAALLKRAVLAPRRPLRLAATGTA
jgi:DNA mismatch endonuclease (patch repair protein)